MFIRCKRNLRLFMLSLLLCILFIRIVIGQNDNCSPFATPVILKGKKFFNTITGEYFPIKGINYYPRPNTGEYIQTNSIDFFTENFKYIWERDIAYFKQLNINVIRIYAVAPGENHDGFMCALQSAGIYVIISLAADCLDCAITKDTAPTCYPASLKTRGQFIISEFARYDNVLAFSAGNEVSLTAASPFVNGPCQKQFIKDMREYIQKCSSTVRQIPVGVEKADVDRSLQAIWYGCRSDPTAELENAEYIGLNAYLHCDGTATNSLALPGFEALLSDFETYQVSVPVILTEFGCIDPSFPTVDGYQAQRNFLQIDTLFSDRYRDQFVGGLVFEYSTELINSRSPFPFTTYGEGNFGVGYLIPENCDDIDTPCSYAPFPQFNTLSAKYASVNTANEPSMEEYMLELETSGIEAPTCPAEFPKLDDYTWPSADVDDLACPGNVFVFCPGVPTECSNLGMPPPPPSTASPVTTAPTISLTPSMSPSALTILPSISTPDNPTTVSTSQPTVVSNLTTEEQPTVSLSSLPPSPSLPTTTNEPVSNLTIFPSQVSDIPVSPTTMPVMVPTISPFVSNTTTAPSFRTTVQPNISLQPTLAPMQSEGTTPTIEPTTGSNTTTSPSLIPTGQLTEAPSSTLIPTQSEITPSIPTVMNTNTSPSFRPTAQPTTEVPVSTLAPTQSGAVTVKVRFISSLASLIFCSLLL